MKLSIPLCAALPQRSFFRIERVIGHDCFADTSQLEYSPDVCAQLLVREKFAGFIEIVSVRRKTERVEHRYDTPRRFGHRRIFHEQSFPNRVSFLLFRQSE